MYGPDETRKGPYPVSAPSAIPNAASGWAGSGGSGPVALSASRAPKSPVGCVSRMTSVWSSAASSPEIEAASPLLYSVAPSIMVKS